MSELIHILLVEDDLGDQELIKISMQNQRIMNEIHVANNGQEGMEFLNRSGDFSHIDFYPDLILLDLNMPVMDGKEFLKEVKSHPKFKTIPVLILTTSDSEKDMLETYDLHANGFINKPIELTEFTNTLTIISNFWFGINRVPRH